MTQTIEQQRAQSDRDVAIAELKLRRVKAAGELAKLDSKIEQLSDADFMARLGNADLRTLTLRERSQVAARLGFQKFKQLVLAGR